MLNGLGLNPENMAGTLRATVILSFLVERTPTNPNGAISLHIYDIPILAGT